MCTTAKYVRCAFEDAARAANPLAREQPRWCDECRSWLAQRPTDKQRKLLAFAKEHGLDVATAEVRRREETLTRELAKSARQPQPLRMPPPPAPHDVDPMRSCYTKKAYPTESLAWSVAVRALHARGGYLRTYQCGHCNQWHLTSHRPRSPRSAA